SGDLDEDAINDLKAQGASIDIWGVGTRLITGWGQPALGGVYKLAAIEKGDPPGQLQPVLKASDTAEKTTTPGVKQVYRFYDRQSGFALADVVALVDEPIPPHGPFEIFDPVHTWKRKVLNDYRVRPLLEPLIVGGRRVVELPSLDAIRDRVKRELGALWPAYRRLRPPKPYIVDLSGGLWALKDRLLRALSTSPPA
ncbi:MAG TPA: nicotinate phosphoribosyltransferase, partial [Limnochordia bacterium]